ncbi:zinc finger, CCHC-type containing protein [Tanacetum coccineum]
MAAAIIKHMSSSFAKLEKFEGVDFRRWQKQMHFMISSMSVVYVLTTPMPEDGGESPTVEQVRKRAKWDHDDYVCKGLILNAFMSTSELNDSILWHARLGHVHFKRMQDMSKDGLIPAFDMDTEKCKTCMLTKITKKPFQNVKRETEVLELIHSDLCDLHATPSLGNKKYFVTFIDDASRFCYVYLLHTKDEALDKFKVFKTEVELQQGSLIKRFRTDRGGEYMDTLYFQSVGIIHETTAPYTPQQNGISERKNRVLKEMVNSMLSYSGLSQGFWGEAMLTACYLLNRVPNKRNRITPYELWTKRKPNLNYLRVWGCRAVVRLPDPKLKTLGERGIECIFVGYAEHSKAFRFYVIEPNDSVAINSIIESRDAIFDENRSSLVPRPSLRIHNGTEEIGGSVVPKEVAKEIVQQPKPELRKSKRNRTPKNFRPEFQLYLIEGTRDEIVAFWKEAINDEMNFIMGNNTWVLADLPPGCKPLGCKWIFKKNLKVDLTKEFLSLRFSMKYIGEADVILGIRIKHKSNRKEFSQSHYIEKVLNKFNYFDCSPVSTPIDTREKLMPNNGQLGFKVSRYTNNPYTQHWKEIQRVLKYLKKTMDYSLIYTGYLSVLEGYTNASWIRNIEDNSSTSGRVFQLGRGEISWASKKQTCITSSTMKSEFVALAVAGKEDEWLRNLILEIPLWSKPIALISICCDSAATLTKAYNQIYNGKSRHLGVRHNIICELITNGVVSIEFLRSQQNLTDHLTKGLARDLVLKSAEGMEKYDPELNILVKTLLFLNAKVVDVPEGKHNTDSHNVEQSTETPSAHVVASESPQRTKQTKASIHQDLSVANVEKRKQANVEEDKGEEAKAKAEKPQVVYRSNPKSSSSKKRKNAEYEVTVQILKKTKADCDKQTIRKGLRKKDEHIDYCLVDEETSVKKVNKKGKGKGQVKLKRNTSCLTLIIRYEFLDPYMESILNDFKVDSHRVDDMLGIPMGGIPLLSLEEICGGRDPFAMDWFAQFEEMKIDKNPCNTYC